MVGHAGTLMIKVILNANVFQIFSDRFATLPVSYLTGKYSGRIADSIIAAGI